MTALVAAAAGALIVGGLVLIPSGFLLSDLTMSRSWSSRWNDRRSRFRRSHNGSGRSWSRARWPIAACSGLVVWLLTGWLVAGAITVVTVIGLPILLATSKDAVRAIDRIEAVEAWTRHLADVLITGTGLEQAITVTARTAPTAIQGEVVALTARFAAHWPTDEALRAFADDLNDATSDLVVAALLLAARRRGPGLSRVLASIGDSVADDVAMRRKVEAERARPRATARAVTLITLGVVALGSLNGTYLQPYQTPLGQLVLAGIAMGFILALVWMRALTITTPSPRFLSTTSTPLPTSHELLRRGGRR
jgi:tight adherence protein B